MTRTRLRVFDDLETLSLAAAGDLAGQVQDAVERQGRCAVVLTGGRTPRRMYELLAGRFGASLPWEQVDLFWGDERYVPHDHPQSNYRLAREAFLDRIAVPPENVHPMPTHHADPEQAAAEYEDLLRGYFGLRSPRFDAFLLGLAANGHVASLFPRQASLDEQRRWVIAVQVPAEPPHRLTMTFPIINQASHVAFLVAGSAKADAVAQALGPGNRVGDVPAAGVAPIDGRVTWWLDAAAAAKLPRFQTEPAAE